MTALACQKYFNKDYWISAKSGWDDPIRPAAKLAHSDPALA